MFRTEEREALSARQPCGAHGVLEPSTCQSPTYSLPMSHSLWQMPKYRVVWQQHRLLVSDIPNMSDNQKLPRAFYVMGGLGQRGPRSTGAASHGIVSHPASCLGTRCHLGEGGFVVPPVTVILSDKCTGTVSINPGIQSRQQGIVEGKG